MTDYTFVGGTVQETPAPLTLRDQFAAAALTGLLNGREHARPEHLAREAYHLADWMIHARNLKKETPT